MQLIWPVTLWCVVHLVACLLEMYINIQRNIRLFNYNFNLKYNSY